MVLENSFKNGGLKRFVLSIAPTTIFRQVLSCRRHIIQEISRCELSGGGRVLISNDKIIYIAVPFINRIAHFSLSRI